MEKKKVVNKIAATALAVSMMPSAYAATSNYHSTRKDNTGEYYYVDSYGNKVYDSYIIDSQGRVLYDGYYFDERDNVIIDENQYYYNYDAGKEQYLNYLNYHLNIDIPMEYLPNFLAAHTQNCDDYQCKAGYEKYFKNEVYNQIPNTTYPSTPSITNPNYTNENTDNIFYTMVKIQNGITKYAYSNTKTLAQYGLFGWEFNSVYNFNDYTLNSVFYEEIYTFGNDYRWNYDIVNKINNNTNLYIWRYQNEFGETKYCVSTIQNPTLVNQQLVTKSFAKFYYNSNFNINDVAVELKTVSSAINDIGYTLDPTSVYQDPKKLTYTK